MRKSFPPFFVRGGGADEVRDNEKHPLQPVMQITGENLERYDNEYCPVIGEGVNTI